MERIELASTPRAIVFAYACAPGRGSEPGAGWGVVRALGTFADCTVLVGPEHEERLAAYAAAHPDSPLRFVTVDVPRWAKYAMWHRLTVFLVYLAWLRRARSVARRLHTAAPFDVACHATYSAYWLPSPVAGLGIPSVWGPMGGGVTAPIRLWPALRAGGIAAELLDLVAVRVAALFPPTRRVWRRVTVAIVQNTGTLRRLPRHRRETAVMLNHALFTDVPDVVPTARGDYALWPSGMESRKVPLLAVRALAHTDANVRMVMIGGGPELNRIEQLAGELGVADRLDIRGRVTREEAVSLMAGAAVCMFAGIREEGGLAFAETMFVGTPVVFLDHGGPEIIATDPVDAARVARIAPGSVQETARRFGAALQRFVDDPPDGTGPNLDREAAVRSLRRAVEMALRSEDPRQG